MQALLRIYEDEALGQVFLGSTTAEFHQEDQGAVLLDWQVKEPVQEAP
jgi:hypothetical protein